MSKPSIYLVNKLYHPILQSLQVKQPQIRKSVIVISTSVNNYRVFVQTKNSLRSRRRVGVYRCVFSVKESSPSQIIQVQRINLRVILILRVSQANDHLITVQAAFMRVNGWWCRVCFSKSPCFGFEIKNTKVVRVIHKLIHSSIHIHLIVVDYRDMGVSLSWKISFLLDCLPFVCFEEVAEKVTKDSGFAVVVASINVKPVQKTNNLLWQMHEEWHDLRPMTVEEVFISCHSNFYLVDNVTA